MGRRIREFDWSKTPLGAIESWPLSLRTSVSLMLNSQHPMWIGWGPEITFLYNDAYVRVLSLAKHPWALGRATREVWAEIWHVIEPLIDKVFKKGEASFSDDSRLFMNRGDFLEETFYSFSYSPIRDESGNVSGLFCPSTEVTSKVLGSRRLATLSELSARSLVEKSVEAACASAMTILGKNPDDVPFVLLYLLDPKTERMRLTEGVGVPLEHPVISPAEVDWRKPGSGLQLWSMAEVMSSVQSRTVSLKDVGGFPTDPVRQPVIEALVLPLVPGGEQRPLGILIVGISAARRLDAEYRAFYDLIA